MLCTIATNISNTIDWLIDVAMIYRARRAEARIQQMLWKVNYADIIFNTTVCSIAAWQQGSQTADSAPAVATREVTFEHP